MAIAASALRPAVSGRDALGGGPPTPTSPQVEPDEGPVGPPAEVAVHDLRGGHDRRHHRPDRRLPRGRGDLLGHESQYWRGIDGKWTMTRHFLGVGLGRLGRLRGPRGSGVRVSVPLLTERVLPPSVPAGLVAQRRRQLGLPPAGLPARQPAVDLAVVAGRADQRRPPTARAEELAHVRLDGGLPCRGTGPASSQAPQWGLRRRCGGMLGVRSGGKSLAWLRAGPASAAQAYPFAR